MVIAKRKQMYTGNILDTIVTTYQSLINTLVLYRSCDISVPFKPLVIKLLIVALAKELAKAQGP